MKNILRALLFCVTLAIALSGAGCTNAPTTDTANTNTTTSTTTTTATPAPTPQIVVNDAATAANLPVTLPVLDAFFSDEGFAADLKTKLGLTDEQINGLRKAAREQTASLRETNADNYNGTTTAATARAAEQVKAVIGAEKTDQLLALVRQRWSSGGEDQSTSASSSANSNTNNTNANRNTNNTAGMNGNASGGNANATGAMKATGSNAGAGNNGNAGNISRGKLNAVPTDTRVVVNAPAYRMDIFDGGRLVKSYKVGIGYPEFPLPTGLRKASSIIVNPTWTPPDEPWVASSNKVKAGQKVEAGSKLNPLGPIKIPIGLPSLIHGGKSPAKLGTFASHGCVGLTSPQIEEFTLKLAQLGGADLNQEKLNGLLKEKTETKNVKLNQSVPVELRYETIVVQDGKLHIYRDVYDRGSNTEENLRTVLSSYGVSADQLSEKERAQAMNALRQMSRDANGNPTENIKGGNSNASANDKNSANSKSQKNESSKVTRAVKGRKEIVIPVAALSGKGYPAPVDLNTGGASNATASNNARATMKRKR
ncbi:MAG: L,D-transpeptidase [Pyrinomonadaceae bacterium]